MSQKPEREIERNKRQPESEDPGVGRREYITTIGLLGVTAIAGCSESDEQPEPTNDDGSDDTGDGGATGNDDNSGDDDTSGNDDNTGENNGKTEDVEVAVGGWLKAAGCNLSLKDLTEAYPSGNLPKQTKATNLRRFLWLSKITLMNL